MVSVGLLLLPTPDGGRPRQPIRTTSSKMFLAQVVHSKPLLWDFENLCLRQDRRVWMLQEATQNVSKASRHREMLLRDLCYPKQLIVCDVLGFVEEIKNYITQLFFIRHVFAEVVYVSTQVRKSGQKIG